MAIRLRRPLALASVATATLAGAVVLRALLAGDGPESEVRGILSPSPSAPAVVSAVPTAPGPLLSVVEPVLQKRVFAAGQQVDVATGIGFLSAESGALETWSNPGATSYYGPTASPDGTLLFSIASGPPNHITERATGKTWVLADHLSPLPGASHGLNVPAVSVAGSLQELVLLDLASGGVTALGISVPGTQSITAFASPDGRKLAVHHGSAVSLLDLRTAQASELLSSIDPGQTTISLLPGGIGFVVEDSSRPGRYWFSWDGVEIQRDFPQGAISPNGRLRAVVSSPGGIDSEGGVMGGYPSISAISFNDRETGRTSLTLLGASPLTNAELGWTASSEAFVVQVTEGYRVVSTAGQTIVTVQDESHVLEPRPSPTIGGLLGTNRGTIINTARNQTIAPLYAELPWRASWTTRPGELAVELNTPGKGRDWPLQVLPFEVRTAPSQPPTFRVQVKSGGECLPLRGVAEPGGAAVACLADGTSGALEAVDVQRTDPKNGATQTAMFAGKRFADHTTVVLHIRLDDGRDGWADANGLGWAK